MKIRHYWSQYVLLLCLLLSALLYVQPCYAAIESHQVLVGNNVGISKHSTNTIKLNDTFQANIRFFGRTERALMKISADNYEYIDSPSFSLTITLETINPKHTYKKIPNIAFTDRSFAFLVPGMPKVEGAQFTGAEDSSYRALSGSVDVYVRQNNDGSYNVSAYNKHVYDFARLAMLYTRSEIYAFENILSFSDNLMYAMQNKLGMRILIPYFDTAPRTIENAKYFIIDLTPDIIAEWKTAGGFDERVFKHIKPSAASTEVSLKNLKNSN